MKEERIYKIKKIGDTFKIWDANDESLNTPINEIQINSKEELEKFLETNEQEKEMTEINISKGDHSIYLTDKNTSGTAGTCVIPVSSDFKLEKIYDIFKSILTTYKENSNNEEIEITEIKIEKLPGRIIIGNNLRCHFIPVSTNFNFEKLYDTIDNILSFASRSKLISTASDAIDPNFYIEIPDNTLGEKFKRKYNDLDKVEIVPCDIAYMDKE